MKKVIIILLTVLFLSGCEDITYLTEVVGDWYITLSTSTKNGTTDTEYLFVADTNDVITGWSVDRSFTLTSDTEMTVTFSTIGEHLVEVLTSNGAYSSLIVDVAEPVWVEPEYSIIKYRIDYSTEDDTQKFYVYDTCYTNGGYNIYYVDMENEYENDTKYVIIPLEVDNFDYWLFMGSPSNMMNTLAIDYTDMSLAEMKIVADILVRYPEESIWDLQDEYNP